jgi:hypothetical protein
VIYLTNFRGQEIHQFLELVLSMGDSAAMLELQERVQHLQGKEENPLLQGPQAQGLLGLKTKDIRLRGGERLG